MAPHAAHTFVQDCLEAGFALAGVTSIDPPERAPIFEQWLEDGMHGAMQWMERHRDLRHQPADLLEDARSIICVATRYAPADVKGGAAVASYARGDDYHKVMKKQLHALCDQWRGAFPDAQFRACVDTAPLLERELAERAGLGRVGKNTMLIDPGAGSWLLLGEVLTTLDIAPTPADHDDPCASCTRCIDACPTEALSPWRLDARRCISAMTIEQRSEIDVQWHDAIGDWLFGCDICQDVCPHNQLTERSAALPRAPWTRDRLGLVPVLDVLEWTPQRREAKIAGTAVTRATLDMMRRNACIVAGGMAGHADLDSIRSVLEAIANAADEPEMVRDAAREAIRRLDASLRSES